LKLELPIKPKRAGLILVGGGDGNAKTAVGLASWMFGYLNAHGSENNTVTSLNTNKIKAIDDINAVCGIEKMAEIFNTKKEVAK
jgi:hypothetical protein